MRAARYARVEMPSSQKKGRTTEIVSGLRAAILEIVAKWSKIEMNEERKGVSECENSTERRDDVRCCIPSPSLSLMYAAVHYEFN